MVLYFLFCSCLSHGPRSVIYTQHLYLYNVVVYFPYKHARDKNQTVKKLLKLQGNYLVLVTMAVPLAIKNSKNTKPFDKNIFYNQERLRQCIHSYKYIGSFILFCKRNTMYILDIFKAKFHSFSHSFPYEI